MLAITSETEIEELAEYIAERYLVGGKVDLLQIATDNEITIIHEDYGPYFLGQLVHENNAFYIHLNAKHHPNVLAPRARFTLAHDFGHFFIDEHRNHLKKGISLAFNTDDPSVKKPPHEHEADHFASHLLMPKSLFITKANTIEPGIESVLFLKNYFNTSIESTAIHYTKMNILPCMFIRWKPDSGKPYSFISDSLANMAGISKKPSLKIHMDYIQSLFFEIETSFPKMEYIENATSLSKWVATIAPGSKTDLMGLEQTFKLGEFGGITFLVFPQ